MSIQVLNFNQEKGSFELLDGELERLLLAKDVKDREIVVISIAGAFRKGKSFLLNFFIRYLQDKYVKKNVAGNWLGNPNDRLDGFVWKGGSTRITTGIHMWSEVFLHDFEDGRKVAIIVIDTQGTFDTKSTMKDCSTIFALSTLLSSVQILNLMQNIQEDDLQHLQYFSEYGRLVSGEGNKPFQKLILLVRDWCYPYEFKYGAEGGQKLLDSILSTYEGQEKEHQSLRIHIKTCFNQVRCFLMPSPGPIVTMSATFNGKLQEIDQMFKDNLLTLVPLLLAPENLIVKKIHGRLITASDFVDYFKSYFGTFQSGKLPKVMTLFNAGANANNGIAVKNGIDYYSSQMTKFCSTYKQHSDAQMNQKHNQVKQGALSIFRNFTLLGTEEYQRTFEEELNTMIETALLGFIEINKTKINLARAVNTFVSYARTAAGAVALIGLLFTLSQR